MGRRRRYAPLLLPLALLVALIPEPASPAFAALPGANGLIAFARGGDIWVVHADGTEERQLTSGAANDTDPAWSADGLRVAFSRNRDIWVMNTDGTSQRKVTNCATASPECAGSDSGFIGPTFAPDGRLAFWISKCNDSGYCVESIYVSQGDGSGLRFLTSGFDPAW